MPILVCPVVDASDVIAGAGEAELRDLEAHLACIEYVPDESQAERIVRALLDEKITSLEEVALPKRWVDSLGNLRVPGSAGFCIVRELEKLSLEGRAWIGGGPGVTATLVTSRVFALRLDVEVASGPAGTRQSPRGELSAPPRRPYPTSDDDAEALEGLAKQLAPHVTATFNGDARLRRDPVLVPICAMTASLVAVANAVGGDKKRAVTWSLFHACLDALNLGEHRGTAERVLLRDHAEHIHVDAPAGLEPRPGQSALGVFASKEDGSLVVLTEEQQRAFPPRVLYSLTGPEPF